MVVHFLCGGSVQRQLRCGLAARKKLKRQETLKAVEFEPRKIRNDTLRIDAGDATEATQDKILSLDAKLTFLNTGRPRYLPNHMC